MCDPTALSYWLGEIRYRDAWMTGSVITRISFSFSSGETTMMTKRTHKKHGKQICWITQESPRECLRYLWKSYDTKTRYIEWKEDNYKA